MKKIFKVAFVFFFVFILIANAVTVSHASGNLDEIENYEIVVNIREDGTLDIKYHIEWKVLDSTSEGPLTWVKIGIPNDHADCLTPLTNNIKSADFINKNGSYVRLDFDRSYNAGETVIFEFTIHQSHMYMLEDNAIKYSFTAGWFDKIEVKNIRILWYSEWVAESTASEISSDGKYLIWNGSLANGEHFKTSVRYPMDTFSVSEDEQFVDGHAENNSTSISFFEILIIVILAFVVIFVLIAIFSDDYDGHSGFGGGRGHSTYIHTSSCARSSCACASHCACACACAGGGRAGCTAKDMYTGKTAVNEKKAVEISLLLEVLKE